MAPTPTPWRAYNDRIYGTDHDSGGHALANTDSPYVQDGAANAAFIVRAVNAHQHLIEALQSAREYFDNLSDADHDGDGFVPNAEMRLVSEIDEALAKAGAA